LPNGVAGGARDRERIDSSMRPESFVFGGDRGGKKMARQSIESRRNDKAAAVEQRFAEDGAVAIGETDSAGRPVLQGRRHWDEVQRGPTR